MIKTEYLTINGIDFIKHYSSERFKIRKIGTDEIYDEAIDPIGTNRVYEETDIKIEGEDIWA